jgi:hypothetical protein
VIETTDGKPVAFHDMRADSFPFRVRCIDMDTEEVVMEQVVYGPGSLKIDGWAPRRIKVEMTMPNGMQYIEGPGLQEERQVPPPHF